MGATDLSLRGVHGLLQPCPLADTRSQRVLRHKKQLEAAQVELASVLPVEGATGREVIQQRIELLQRAVKDPTFEERYPCLDLQVLGWRDAQGFPKLVPFQLGDPLFWITARHWSNWSFAGSIQQFPSLMAGMYGDIFAKFQGEFEADLRQYPAWRDAEWRKGITSRFSGLIPQKVREKIREASPDFSISVPRVERVKSGFFGWKREVVVEDIRTRIFLIAEVEGWTVNKEIVPHPDPLVVGYMGGCLWLICSFEETPLEKYVRQEFAV